MVAARFFARLAIVLAASSAHAQDGLPAIAGNAPAPSASAPLTVEQQFGFSKGFLNSMKEQMENLKAAKRLPVRGLILLEMKDGKTVLVSEDGRLAIIGGKWMDLWEKKQITSVEDAVTLDRIDFVRLGIDVNEITSLRIGRGSRKVVVFADPIDKDTKGLVAQMTPLLNDYTFHIVLVPRKTGPSNDAIAKLVCSPDKSAAVSAFTSGAYQSLPAPSPNCDYIPVRKGMTTAIALRIPGLPLVVREDGLTAHGPSISLVSSLKVGHR
jgi:thiol:disulfide interchange protein DsbC